MFHSGERQVQRLMGVEAMAAKIGRGIRPTIAPSAAAFLAEMTMVVVSMVQDGHLQAFLLHGETGFVSAPDENTWQIRNYTASPVLWVPHVGSEVGMIAIDLGTRRRLRLNGTVQAVANGTVTLSSRQCYANCPKYIQRRHLEPSPGVNDTVTNIEQAVSRTDTFFIATMSPEGGLDVSHRGGQPGFLQADGPSRLTWTEYDGNTMYNTLGNLQHSSEASLLLMDFSAGHLVQLTGSATVDLTLPNPQVAFQSERMETAPLRWQSLAVEPSPFNPPLSDPARS